MRFFTKDEENKIKFLTNFSVNMTYIGLTETGLKKSILDATLMVREYFKSFNLHDFETQKQGGVYKITIPTSLLTEDTETETIISLYRPVTKKGDPRIWFYGLKKIVKPNEIISIIAYDEKLFVFNLSTINLEKVFSEKSSKLYNLINNIYKSENNIANELLEKLRKISKRGPIKSLVQSDTGVGRTLEYELGIEMNSSKLPDYKGIELKAFRKNGKSGEKRKTLFAQVPDWKISKFKSSKEILENFGYLRGEILKLYCTVTALKRNPQGLMLRIDAEDEKLVENSDNEKIGDFVAWKIQTLKERLLEKHKETFWVMAKSIFIDGKEHFDYQKVEHTKKPIVSNLSILLQQAEITLDHLIKMNSKGSASEKGPLFKIASKSLNLLFPESVEYNLK